MDAIVESGTPLTVDAHVHHTSDSAPELLESSVSSQVSRYSFATHLIENESDHETVDSSIVTFSGPYESPRVDYDFMVVPTESSSSESSEFLVMIQHVVSNAFSFTSYLEFLPGSNLLLARFNVCHPRHPICLFFSIVRSYV